MGDGGHGAGGRGERGKGLGWAVGVLVLSTLSGAAGCGRSNTEGARQAIQIKGSDTMVNLAQAWAEAYMASDPEALVAVTGGGSGTGIAALINGTCDIANSSRPLKDKEVELARARGVEPQEIIAALDGIAVVVHPSNPIASFTPDQLAGIFSGAVSNWRTFGWRDASIVVLSREVNSGTHEYFKEHVLHRGDPTSTLEFAASALLMPSSQAIADEVAHNPAAIGYYGLGYLSPRQKAVPVAADTAAPAIVPTLDAVVSGSYPIARPLFLYTNGEPTGEIRRFIDFILGPAGQAIVREQDFVPLRGAGS